MAAEIVHLQTKQSLTPLYDAAVKALQKAKEAEEFKVILDRAAALEHYAKLIQDKKAEADFKVLRLNAKRHLGEVIKAGKKAGTIQGPGRPSLKNKGNKRSKPKNISKNLSSESQKLAGLTDTEFNEKVEQAKKAVVSPPPRSARPAPVVTPGQKQFEDWLDKIPVDFLLTYCIDNVQPAYICEAITKTGVPATIDGEAQEERKQLQERIRQLEEEKRQLEERLKAPAATDIAAEFGAMSSSERNAVMFKIVADHLPSDPRARQEWSKDACSWIQNLYGKLAGPRENPWKWRQKVHRLIKLPPGIDAGKASSDEIGDNPTTATEADMARQVAPPRPAGDMPKLSDAPDYRRMAPPGTLLKQDKPPRGRNGKDTG